MAVVEVQEGDKPNCTSAFQASACPVFDSIPLDKASHMARPWGAELGAFLSLP